VFPLADGLGSVRSVAGSANAVLETRAYDPYGQPLASTGTPQTPFGFTGELADANGLLYLRARHYAPRLGAFPSLDPYEGSAARPMSLNGYSWVEGNAVNRTDPSGRTARFSKSYVGDPLTYGATIKLWHSIRGAYLVSQVRRNRVLPR
jgi:RHS repeat-associated protein